MMDVALIKDGPDGVDVDCYFAGTFIGCASCCSTATRSSSTVRRCSKSTSPRMLTASLPR